MFVRLVLLFVLSTLPKKKVQNSRIKLHNFESTPDPKKGLSEGTRRGYSLLRSSD